MKHIGIILFHLYRYYRLFSISNMRLITCEINKIFKKYNDLPIVWSVGGGEWVAIQCLVAGAEKLN